MSDAVRGATAPTPPTVPDATAATPPPAATPAAATPAPPAPEVSAPDVTVSDADAAHTATGRAEAPVADAPDATAAAGTVPPADTAPASAAAAATPPGADSRTADIVAGPGGVMTDEVGVVTGDLTLRSELSDGQVTLHVQYKDADEWYVVTGGRAPLRNPADLDAVHTLAVALLNRPEG